MVRPLPPDWWPFATDEERAEGWGDPKFDRRKKGSPNDRRSTSPAAPHDDVSERVAAILFGAVDDERFDMVMAALSPAAPRPEGLARDTLAAVIHDLFGGVPRSTPPQDIAYDPIGWADYILARLSATSDPAAKP